MKYIALHHTADPSLSPQLYKVNRFHKNKDWGGGWKQEKPSELGWYVGYNFFCERNGNWTQTRRIGEETIANRGHNCTSGIIGEGDCDTISFCMAGDFRTQKPTELQTAMFTSFVNQKRKEYPGIEVVGHRDLQSTTCPALPQEYIDQFNVRHSPDQEEKAQELATISSQLGIIQSILDSIRAFISNIKR